MKVVSSIFEPSSFDTTTHLFFSSVVAKYTGFRGQADNPWFAGIVKTIAPPTCVIKFEDGDTSVDVTASEVKYAPGRNSSWGKGELRGNDKLPENASSVKLQ